MTASFALGLDLGGGGARCLLLDMDTGASTCEYRALAPIASPGLSGLGYDFDLPSLNAAFAEATRACLARAGASRAQVRGIACTSQRHSTVVIDAQGTPLLASPNRDARAAAEGLRLAAEHGVALHALSGHWPLPIFTAARLQWLRDQRPEVFERAACVLAASDWLAWRLSGRTAADPTQAGESLLFELRGRRWSRDWTERLGLPCGLFPESLEPGSPLGELQADAAIWLGLEAGTPVAVGAADTQSGLLGCGVLEPGRLAAVAGTTAPVQRVLRDPLLDPEARVWSGQHVVASSRVLESNAGAMGESLHWFASLLHPGHPQPVARLMADAAQSPAGANGALSTLGAEVMNARAPGMPYATFGLAPMAMPSGAYARETLSRAVIEGAACALRANAEQLSERAAEPTLGPLVLSGGLSRSPTFCQILANVVGEPVRVAACSEASSLGAALCAAVGSGFFESLPSAAAALVSPARNVDPDPTAVGASQEAFDAWQASRLARAEADAAAGVRATGAVLRRAQAGSATGSTERRAQILATADLDENAASSLRELGELTHASFREMGRMLKDASLVEAAAGFDVFITEIDVVGAEAMAKLPDLRVIASCRGDAVNVDVAAATLHGIPVLNTPGRNADAVADLTVAFLLMLARRLTTATAFLRAGGVEPGDLRKMGEAFVQLRGRELWGSTIGLIGLGAVGNQVAARLSGFGARLLVHDPAVDSEGAARAGAERVEFDELLARSDYISLHAAVNDSTRGLISADAIARMKPGAALINTARAALVDEAALASALESGQLAAAALDVFSVEPPGSNHPLLALPQVIATPHVGGNTAEVAAHQGQIVAEDLARLLQGEAPRNLCNPEVLDQFDWTTPRPVPTPEQLAEISQAPGPAVTDLQRK